jgi:S1-C subfamily serine protease
VTLFHHAGHKAVRVTVTTTYDDGREQVLELAGPDLMVDTLVVYPARTFGPMGTPDEVNVRVGGLTSYVPSLPRR